MAVSKELLARYKEMKAKGIQITLSELKAQMEVEESTNQQTSSTSQNLESTTQHEAHASYSNDIPNNATNNSTPTYSQNTTYTTNTYSNQTQTEQPANNISNNEFEQPKYNYNSGINSSISNINSNTITNTNQPQNPTQNTATSTSWTTTYSNQNNFNEPIPRQNTVESNYSQNIQQSQNFENKSTVFNPQPVQNNITNIQPTVTPQIQQPQTQTQVQQTVTEQTQNIMMPDTIDAPVKKFGVIGYPLGHSLSSYMHEAGFKSLGIKASYEVLETPPETLVDRIKFFKTNNYMGFNVTIPLKLPVIMFLDEVDQSADLVNAVNTVTINPVTKELKGYNTDVIGFRDAIPKDFTLFGKTAGVLGTGGAARAAITALAQSQMKEIKLYTRNIPNCLDLLNYLRKTFPNTEFSAHQIERIRDLSDVNLLVNTTPIGMLGRAADMTPVEENELRTLPQGALVYDVIYNPKKTILLKLAQKYGYRTLNGVDMFIHQAVAAEKIWTGRIPDFKDMKIAVLENL